MFDYGLPPHVIGVTDQGIPSREPEPDEEVTYVKGWWGEGWSKDDKTSVSGSSD